MKLNFTLLLLWCCVFDAPDNSIAFQKDSSLTLIIVPKAAIVIKMLDSTDPVDVRIQNHEVRFPRMLYDYLGRYKEFTLSTRFDEVTQLKDQIDLENREGSIEKLKLISKKPEAFLFSSFDKLTEEVELRAEIIDPRLNPLAVESVRIKFSDFLIDGPLRSKIEELGSLLVEYIRKNLSVTIPIEPTSSEAQQTKEVSVKGDSLGSANWLVSPKNSLVPLIPVLKNQKVSLLTHFFLATTLITYNWKENENKVKNKYIEKIEQILRPEDKAMYLIGAEKANARNEIAKNVFGFSAIISGVLLINDIIQTHKDQKVNVMLPKAHQKVYFEYQIRPNYFNKSATMSISMSF